VAEQKIRHDIYERHTHYVKSNAWHVHMSRAGVVKGRRKGVVNKHKYKREKIKKAKVKGLTL
jgi:hypothetical protein